jgi:hypothetical protein
MAEVVYLNQALISLTCWDDDCGVQFAIPHQMHATIKARGGTFYCPRGHLLGLGKSDTEKLREELEKERRRTEFEKNRRESAEREEKRQRHSAATARGKLKAQSDRVKAGVCPCCNRTFQQLARHMKSQHPDWSGK